jgi:hypothetical protein
MDQPNPLQESSPIPSELLSDAELRYYYFGFHEALKRYRTITIIGWMVVVIGCVSFPVGWSVGRPGGIVDIALSFATVVAGLGLVWQSISSLDAYIRIVLPFVHNGEQHPMIHEVAEIMKDVDDGGWQEAYAAIRKMEDLQSKYGLPALR